MSSLDPTIYCSFCGGSEHEKEVIIVGHNGCKSPAICDICLDICNDVVAARKSKINEIEGNKP